MADYKKSEARAWARENMRGVANVVIPSFTNDLRSLNEKGIRHDIRKEIEYGFWGTLLVSEVVMTIAEYGQFVAWSREEAAGRLKLIHHASFNTLADNIEAARLATKEGAELVLLSYPSNFYATSSQQIYDYTRSFCEAVDLGVILFPVPHWGFERVHPAGMEPAMVERIVRDIPNIVAIKAESGMPTIAGFVQTYHRHSKDVVVTFPVEAEAIPLAMLVDMQFMGTSNSELYGPTIPRLFNLVREKRFEEAMEIYWRIHPARMANMQISRSYMGSTQLINRMVWKYEGWLNGFNGGPLRQPTMKIVDAHMRQLRSALKASGIEPTADADSEFFVGRNPV